MAGLLAWAADVVGGNGQGSDGEEGRIPVAVFSPEQQQYARELDLKAASLRRSIQDLRLRILPPHISQRLPHLHAHSIASNADLALQLNSHSSTRQQAQLREATLQEENAAYEKAISNCEKKIKEKLHEADVLQNKLKEMDLIEKDIKAEWENKLQTIQVVNSIESPDDSRNTRDFDLMGEPSRSVKYEELEDKKRELRSVEEMVQSLESQWSLVQHESIKKPSPGQREKLLEEQLHSLIEQLMAKQAQAEEMMRDIHAKEKEVERLNGLRRRSEDDNDGNTPMRIGGPTTGYRAYQSGGPSREMRQQRLVLLMRPALVVYILALHVIVFVKISAF